MTRFPTWKVLVCLILTMPLPVLAVDDYQFERSIGKPPSIGEPINLAVDAAGNMLVTDRANGKIVRATPQGQISSPFTEAQGLRRPSAITFGPNGRLLVADEQQGGRVFSFASARPGAARRIIALAPGTAATGFGESSAGGIAADTAGNIYVTDQFRSVVSKFSPSGERLATFGKKGSEPGAFQGPRGIAVDRQGNVYVADEYNNRIQKLDPEGRVLAMSDAQALGATVAGGLGPMSVAVDSKGEIWVAAHTNFAVYKLDPNFHISVRLETFGRLNGQLAGPVSVAVDAQDNVYVLDRSRRIQKFSPIGNFMSKVEFPPAKPGELTAPTGVLVDRDGTSVWVSDTANFRIQKFAADGTPLLTFGRFGQGDGEFNGAESIAQDRDGNLWIVDSYNHRVQKFAPDGRFLLKVGSMGRGNGEFLRTKVVATDDTRGYVYVNDWHNARVQKFDLNGRFLASFGNAGDFKQQVTGPTGLAIDKAGNVYVSSWFNNAIQKFDSNGKWLATLGGPGSGDGQFKGPARLSMTPDGRLVVADWGNSRVQVLEEAGGFVTKFGSPGRANGAFDQPVGVSVDGAGNVFVSDAGNSRVQLFHFSKHTELPITSPVRHAAAPGGHRDVFVQVSIYDIADGHDMDFERALQETRPLLQAERSFINERVLRNIDGFTLQYATYSKFSDETAADQTTRSRLRSLLPY